ncbi:tRNA (guanosine(37)-N1)-methyltransferase TrmD [Lapillicoccus sp.]|uniref:tRNA (guanosine(37)-N1)-methyltransferase TrmD n=1 Tax=Lapillicoccus sp. TaxID=1909287 RepID=UPI00398390B1
MRIDVVSIFPDYLAPLGLSLIGKARDEGLLDVRVHDLREHAHDRHRSVDDTPYGGGAGMVMKPEPWGAALDEVLAGADGAALPHLIVPGPGGMPFTQARARELATEEWLVFACGRYEGIDERVQLDAATRMRVSVISLGDYVLNGGEVAVLAIVEAVARLLPGVIGNAGSLVEESHEDGLLEYPVYTKPALWRGLKVPPVLLSGDHGAIRDWRHEQRLHRTATRRPDLLHASAALRVTAGESLAGAVGLELVTAASADAPELLVLQRACWVPEARANASTDLPPLTETLDEVRASFEQWRTWLVRGGGRLVGSVRGRVSPLDPTVWESGRLMVAPDLQGRGLGRALLAHAEAAAPSGCATWWINTGARSVHNIRMSKRAGYRQVPGPGRFPGTVDLTKRRPRG